MASWVMALSSHVHALYTREEGLSSQAELWAEGVIETAFWMVWYHAFVTVPFHTTPLFYNVLIV